MNKTAEEMDEELQENLNGCMEALAAAESLEACDDVEAKFRLCFPDDLFQLQNQKASAAREPRPGWPGLEHGSMSRLALVLGLLRLVCAWV